MTHRSMFITGAFVAVVSLSLFVFGLSQQWWWFAATVGQLGVFINLFLLWQLVRTP